MVSLGDVERFCVEGNVDGLINALKDSDIEVRISAADALGKIGDPRALDPLINALNDPDSDVCTWAAGALGKIGDPRAVEPLINALKDSNSGLRREPAHALGKIGDPRAVEPLIDALKESDGWVIIFAAMALGEIGDPRAVEPLIDAALKDSNRDVSDSAARALGKIGDLNTVKVLIKALNDPDSGVRNNAAMALGEIGDPRAVQPLIGALKDSDSEVRKAAAYALGEIGDKRAVGPLIDALKYSDNNILTINAIAALGEIGDSRAVVPIIINALTLTDINDTDSYSRIHVEDALDQCGYSKVFSPLITALTDQEDNTREIASIELSEIGEPAVEILIDILDYGSLNEDLVCDTLSKIGNSAVRPLMNAFINSDWNHNYRYALLKIGTPAFDSISQLLNETTWKVRYDALVDLFEIDEPKSFWYLIGALSDVHPMVRRLATKKLGEMSDPRAVGPLMDALKDSDDKVRKFAADALTNLDEKTKKEDKIPDFTSYNPISDKDALKKKDEKNYGYKDKKEESSDSLNENTEFYYRDDPNSVTLDAQQLDELIRQREDFRTRNQRLAKKLIDENDEYMDDIIAGLYGKK